MPLRTRPPLRKRFRIRLRDGTRVTVRWVEPSDKPRFKDGLSLFSPQTLYRRFFAPITELSDEQLRFFTEVDQVDHVAWGVLDDDHPELPGIAVGRWVRTAEDPAVAEWAAIVADRYQGRGIGTLLLAVLEVAAAAQGLRTLRCQVLAENDRFIRTLAASGGKVAHEADGVMRVELPVYARASQTPRTEQGRVFGRMISAVRDRIRAPRAPRGAAPDPALSG
jgi:GNAT superfamily N-acetyltransferase